VAPWAVETSYLPWSPETFPAALRAHDVAVLPVRLNPYTACKSANRLALALHAGLAVAAGAAPSHAPFSAVCRLDDWDAGLEAYVADADLRRRDASAGKALAERLFSPAAVAEDWRRFFEETLKETVKT
jgi:hypothetical protein